MKRIHYRQQYGDEKIGLDIEAEKKRNSTDYEKQQANIKATNLERRGVEYSFQSKDVLNNCKNTWIKNYGVDNPSKVPEVLDKIKTTKFDLYGGYGWDSPIINAKYINTMIDKYGVPYGCLTQNCIDKRNGCDSKVNLLFAQKLKENDIDYSTEYIISHYRYDFKINNVLVELNPTPTHNLVWNPFGNHEGLKYDYHHNKALAANDEGLVCIAIWDWSDENKILNAIINNSFLIKDSEIVKHWYNMKTKEHIIDNNFDDSEMIQKGFLPIADDGQQLIFK